MSEENSITIKKADLWKYSTLLLVAVVIVGGFFVFSGKGTVNGNATDGGNVNLNTFLNNKEVYPSLGPDDAKNVVIEFSDFQCPYCAMASGLPSWTSQYPQYNDLIDTAGKIQKMAANNELRFVYVPMSFLGQESVYAAEAGYCAHEQGKFWEMHDEIFKAHDSKENNGKYSYDNLKKLAQGISGLDTEKFNDCLDNKKYSSYVQKSANEARSAASGTPTFYLNGQKINPSWAQISSALA